MADTVTIHAAKTHLSKLVARAEAGEEIVIARGDKPVAKLVPLTPPPEAHPAPARRRTFGCMAGSSKSATRRWTTGPKRSWRTGRKATPAIRCGGREAPPRHARLPVVAGGPCPHPGRGACRDRGCGRGPRQCGDRLRD